MEGFNIESTGLTRSEFFQAIHRMSRKFYGGVIGLCVAVFLLICLVKEFNIFYLIFPGSVALALLLYYEMKAFANYGKFDYENVTFHFRFEPDRWVVIRGKELDTRAEYTWEETAGVWETGKNLLLVPSEGMGSYTLPKRSLTPEQIQTIKAWSAAGKPVK